MLELVSRLGVIVLLKIFSDLRSRKRVILVSPYASANMVFLFEALLVVSDMYEHIGIVEGMPVRIDLLENIASSKGYEPDKILSKTVVFKPGFKPTIPVLVYGLENIDNRSLRLLSYKFVFGTTSKLGELHRILYAKRARLEQVGKEYILTYNYKRTRLKITEKGIEIVSSAPPGVLGRALSELMKAIAEYGPLKRSDAVYVLVGSLGIDKRYAQALIAKLVEKKYIKIEYGYIIVEDYST